MLGIKQFAKKITFAFHTGQIFSIRGKMENKKTLLHNK
jgi:hypothetical protein